MLRQLHKRDRQGGEMGAVAGEDIEAGTLPPSAFFGTGSPDMAIDIKQPGVDAHLRVFRQVDAKASGGTNPDW
jgi:hypothetical protein